VKLATVRVTKRRALAAVVAFIVVLGIATAVLPYVGGGSSGLTKLFP